MTSQRRPIIFYSCSFSKPLSVSMTTRSKRRVGEVAGVTAAECSAVCCCCPCSLVNLLFLAVYRVPRGICRKAWAHIKKKKKRRRKTHLLPRPAGSTVFNDDGGGELRKTTTVSEDDDEEDDDVDAVFEKEMWDRFYGAGFWRSATSAST